MIEVNREGFMEKEGVEKLPEAWLGYAGYTHPYP